MLSLFPFLSATLLLSLPFPVSLPLRSSPLSHLIFISIAHSPYLYLTVSLRRKFEHFIGMYNFLFFEAISAIKPLQIFKIRVYKESEREKR